MKTQSPKHPCVGCVYYDACGNTNRTVPCDGRVTIGQLPPEQKEQYKKNQKNKNWR